MIQLLLLKRFIINAGNGVLPPGHRGIPIRVDIFLSKRGKKRKTKDCLKDGENL
jgi:hypothetical protein